MYFCFKLYKKQTLKKEFISWITQFECKVFHVYSHVYKKFFIDHKNDVQLINTQTQIQMCKL